MTFNQFSGHCLRNAAVAAIVLAFSPALFAQGPSPELPTPSTPAIEATAPVVQPAATFVSARAREIDQHKFWDMPNCALFIADAAGASADFVVTRSNLQSGGQELNPVVRIFGRSTGGLAANFAGETASIVALSYFFHRTGHHRLERAVSMVNISASVGAVSYGTTHR